MYPPQGIGGAATATVTTIGGSGIILTDENSATLAHGLGAVPNWAIATASNDVAVAAGVQIAISGANITVGYPIGVTQPEDGTFYYQVGV